MTISDPRDLRKAWEGEYARLARRLSKLLPSEPVSLVEIGCGRGELTIPLTIRAPAMRVLAIDRFAAPYSSDRERLVRALERNGLARRVRVLVRDGPTWLSRQRAGRFNAVISSEFLPEVTARELSAFFHACFRAIEAGGTTAHVFLSPVARNVAQRLTIEADSDPRWTPHLPREWFSPSPSVALSSLAKAGFGHAEIQLIPSRLRFAGRAARRQLRRWGVREAFDRSRRRELAAHGLELPDWLILSGRRPRRARRRAAASPSPGGAGATDHGPRHARGRDSA